MRERTPSADDTPKRAPLAPTRGESLSDISTKTRTSWFRTVTNKIEDDRWSTVNVTITTINSRDSVFFNARLVELQRICFLGGNENIFCSKNTRSSPIWEYQLTPSQRLILTYTSRCPVHTASCFFDAFFFRWLEKNVLVENFHERFNIKYWFYVRLNIARSSKAEYK